MEEPAGPQTQSLQALVDDQKQKNTYGTFSGVFRPTIMTIVGVIMFMREGWVVGNAGLLGAIFIILAAYFIVTTTALSMSCIVTNVRVGAGGAFSMITKSLGLEVGGAVGIPLFLAQAFAGTMYIFGFREGLAWVFSDWITVVTVAGGGPLSEAAVMLILDLISFVIMFGIAYVSTAAAFNVQYFVLAAIIIGLLSFYSVAFFPERLAVEPTLFGDYRGAAESGFKGTTFWAVFAIFFPAATGIMAGANLSGDLKDPRRNIPRGTLLAIAVSSLIYISVAYLLSRVATVDELLNNYNVMMDKALFPIAVWIALLGATFSCALSCLIGAPRILSALAEHRIFPRGEWLAKQTSKGEPRNALILTGGFVLAGILVRDLNLIAPMITMFFLITYMMVNLVVVVEQGLGMVSFRPTFPVPRLIPIAGTLSCLFAMFIINPVLGLISVVMVIGFYFYLTRRQIQADHGDMRSGLFVSLAEWAAKHTYDLPNSNERSWKPNLLIPFSEHREIRGEFGLIRDLTFPKGSVTLLGLTPDRGDDEISRALPALGNDFLQEGVFSRWAQVGFDASWDAIGIAMQTLKGTFFKPNVLFLRLPDNDSISSDEFQELIDLGRSQKMGVLVFANEPVAGLGQKHLINVWVRDQSPDWEISMDLGNIDLALLTAYKLSENWDAAIRLVIAIPNPEHLDAAHDFLMNMLDLARLLNVEIVVEESDFKTALLEAPQADIDLFGLPDPVNFEFMRSVVTKRRSACMFVKDSGDENILA